MNDNRISGILAILIGSIYLFATWKIPDAVFSYSVGPKAFPRVIGWGAILTGIVLILVDLLQHKDKAVKKFTLDIEKKAGVLILITVGAGLLYAFTFERLGFVLSTCLFMFIVTNVVNWGKWITNIVVSVLFGVGGYIFFAKILALSLPRGIMFF